jgi:hypothetical protein
MPGMYKKIESRIMKMKEKEELWKGRYSELAKQVKELTDMNSKRMKQMDGSLVRFDSRLKASESQARKVAERAEDISRLCDKKIADVSQFARELSRKIDEKDEQMRKLRVDVMSQVNTTINKHERTFDSVLEKIDVAIRKMEGELQMQESLYQKMDSAKRFMENYRPPRPEPLEPAFQASPGVQEPEPETGRFQSETQFIYEPGSPRIRPQGPARRAPRRPEIDFDDDIDVDDIISGKMGNIRTSVDTMTSNVSGITERLATIEKRMSDIGIAKNPQIERLDDKIRMYSESIADVHSRMGAVEKGLRDGMTPMMEAMKMLTETVKSMKEESGSGASLAKPTPPDSWDSGEIKARPVPARRLKKPRPEW